MHVEGNYLYKIIGDNTFVYKIRIYDAHSKSIGLYYTNHNPSLI